ncbi:MAG: tRNA dihydrouridine synthase DusB [Deltaproteobacteria bacterium]|nr:tRNA dihydrouridine synthase DusB [Deltaproteobacteria bacterium]
MLQLGPLTLRNRLVMAPMSGITNLPFRRIAKRMGAGLVVTEMISAVGLTRRNKKTCRYLQTHPEERPLSVQIFGSEPAIMAEAARMAVGAGADLVDINMGCPARKVVKTGAGGALLRSPGRIGDIITAVRAICPVPLTVKIRAGWSPGGPSATLIARIAEDCGADAVILHPRWVSQGFSGRADWDIIAHVKSRVRIPVIGNGDVRSPFQALAMREQTGCDGVMIGRAAIGNPWIFQQTLDLEQAREPKAPAIHERKEIISIHFSLLMDLAGEERAARIMRGLLMWYTKGLPFGNRFRAAFTGIEDLPTMTAAVDAYFSCLEDTSRGLPGACPRENADRALFAALIQEHVGP